MKHQGDFSLPPQVSFSLEVSLFFAVTHMLSPGRFLQYGSPSMGPAFFSWFPLAIPVTELS